MIIPRLIDIGKDALSCLAPILCECCGQPLVHEEQVFCISCHRNLPVTNFHLLKSNPFIDKFYGRLNLNAGAAFLYFSKHGLAQHIIHQLKYRGRPKLGESIGHLYGEYLLESSAFQQIDYIIPIPLHYKRKRQRGYNQSEAFGRGLSQSMKLTVRTDLVTRSRVTNTQTRKSRVDRFKNLDGAFSIRLPEALTGKHVLLVDDVLTTGATLEGCAQEFFKVPGIQISLATIGFAYFQ